MTASAVTYSDSVSCPKCGLKFPGYLEVESDGTGKIVCPKCGSMVTQQLPSDFVPQVPPDDYEDPAHPHVHHTHYPGLYASPKQPARFDLVDIVKIGFSSEKAFKNLYLSTDLRRALAIVLVFSMLSVAVSILVSVDMADIVGYDARDAIELGIQAFVAWMLAILTYMIFSVLAAAISKGIFGGRGERSTTLALVGYCYPAYVLVNVVMLLIFQVSFSGVGVGIQELTPSDLDQVTVGLAALVVGSILGLLWLLIITSRAISVANDTSVGEASLTAVLSVAATGIIFLIVNALVSLPLGLSF
jgi:DNA-directed RNA polymerase subunit RPC12/RpoP